MPWMWVPQAMIKFMRILRLALALLGATLMLTGCVVPAGTFSTTIPVGQQPTQSSAPSTPTTSAPSAPVATTPTQPTTPPPPVETGPDIPAGYTDVGSGLAVRAAEWGVDFNSCSYYDVCMGVLLYAYEPCTSGGYIEANVLSGNVIVTFTNDIIPSMQVGDTYLSVLGAVGYGTEVTMEPTEMYCW